MPTMTGKRALVEMLIAEGVEYVFGNPGTSETPFMDALQDYPQLNFMLSLQENSAVAMADGYARGAGKPAFVNLHIAGGLAGGISMLYDSFKGGTPLVLTAGNSDTRQFLTDPVLSGDLVEMTRQYTKWSVEIQHASEIPIAVRRAFREAKTPPTGPVFMSFPWDSLDDTAEIDIVPSSAGYHRIRPDVAAVSKAADILGSAASPVMVVGDRVAQSGAVSDAVQVAELLGARVYAAAYTEVNFPTSHPQFAGVLNLNSPGSRDKLAGADALLAVGTNVFSSFLYVPQPYVNPRTRLVHLDSAYREVEKVYPHRGGHGRRPKGRPRGAGRRPGAGDAGLGPGGGPDQGRGDRPGEGAGQRGPRGPGPGALGQQPHVGGANDGRAGRGPALRRHHRRRVDHLQGGHAGRHGLRRARQPLRRAGRSAGLGHARPAGPEAGQPRPSR